MAADITLSDLLDLSIGTPEPASVNFGALRALLRALLGHLDLRGATTEWTEPPAGGGAGGRPESHPCLRVEEKLRRVETRLAALDKLPGGAELLSRAGAGQSPVGDMWQLMQLRRAAQATEDGVSQAMALIEDLLKEIRELRESRDGLQREVQALQTELSQLNVSDLVGSVVGMERCRHQVEELEKVTRNFTDKMSQYPQPEELKQVVTWEEMQAVLQKDGTGSSAAVATNARPLHPVSAAATGGLVGTTPMSGSPVPATPPISTTPSPETLRRVSSTHPETVETLQYVGGLRDRHECLEARVTRLEEAGKAAHSQLQHFEERLMDIDQRRMPSDLPEQLSSLQSLTEALQTNSDRSSALLRDVQGAILQLRTDCEKQDRTVTDLMKTDSQRSSQIDHLCKSVEELGEKKADKELVQTEINADKRALETKASRTQLDVMTGQLNGMFQELLSKISSQEQDWHKVVENISTEMESKLNRIELEPLKKQLEQRWRMIQKQLRSQPAPQLDDAAGIRKQLVARFHCISCARPVDMLTPGPLLVTVPPAPNLPSRRSSRPYTVYELEQIRQHCRSEPTDYGYLSMSRNCGGGHTLTHPAQRHTRLQHATHPVQPDEDGQVTSGFVHTQITEVDILGLDGRIYKGRLNRQSGRMTEEPKLPTISPREGKSVGICRSKDTALHPFPQNEAGVGLSVQPHSAKSGRSRSASHYSLRDQPESSNSCLPYASPPQPPLDVTVDLSQSEEEPVTVL
ncbi:uncharacterized protein C16orf96 homolog isoform X2 [Denticeps clupeoides]|uniref:uncharacterized protein C16orf96 homolog isoform X2 n=1 Tax=Denticeps clupeoides TaxID=299321 RepID=UPI0010A3C91C|nr:uncharacterized protein C16orf96 homolog isoform X2 [Denticeps clupeoides]